MFVVVPSSSYTTTDLRRPEVVEAAMRGPIVVREGKTGRTLVVLTQETVDRCNMVAYYAGLLARAVVELQRADPSPAHLGEISFLVELAPARRDQVFRGFAEAVAAALGSGDATPAADFIAYMAGGIARPSSGPLVGEFDEETTEALDDRFGGPTFPAAEILAAWGVARERATTRFEDWIRSGPEMLRPLTDEEAKVLR